MSANRTEQLHFSDASKRVLVTGGTGFVGRLLVNALLEDGQEVTLLTRNPEQAERLFNGRVSCIQNMQALPSDSRIDVVINLAGARILGWRWTQARQKVLRDSRIGLTQKIDIFNRM
jgi:NAD dependent epimerase/dehydratase family enzyme